MLHVARRRQLRLFVFDRVSDHSELGANPRTRTAVADYLGQKAALEAHLRSLDHAQKLTIEEIVTTAGFERETMVS